MLSATTMNESVHKNNEYSCKIINPHFIQDLTKMVHYILITSKIELIKDLNQMLLCTSIELAFRVNYIETRAFTI